MDGTEDTDVTVSLSEAGSDGNAKKKNETTFFGCKFAVSPSETVSETVPYAADLGPPTVVRTILL